MMLFSEGQWVVLLGTLCVLEGTLLIICAICMWAYRRAYHECYAQLQENHSIMSNPEHMVQMMQMSEEARQRAQREYSDPTSKF